MKDEQSGASHREVRDTMGALRVPADAYYGAQTARAIENFPLTGLRANPEFIRALAAIKLAAARANGSLGLLLPETAAAIEQAAREVFDGGLRHEFPVDAINAGAGTSMHMNANEVIAARAAEILSGDRGRTDLVHPNDQVNLGQSTNDVIPTATRLSGFVLARKLGSSARALADALGEKAREFDPVVKSGRTHLQDAVPVRLGQEFGAYALCVGRWADRITQAADGLCELGIGGSAAGTGLNTHPRFRARVVEELSALYNRQFRPAEDLFEAMQSHAAVVEVMSAARGLALDLLRITNDLRLLSSGPRTGLAEISLPPVQPGSSIMPGKVNPVIAESTAMVCYQVIGCDATVAGASAAGQLELNVMMPVIAWNLLFALEILGNAASNLASRGVAGVRADAARCREYAEGSVSLATILNPVLGYEKTAELVKEAVASRRSLRDVLETSGLLTPEQIAEIFDLRRWTEPGILE
jgi:aspartate ammonia-lyase